MMVMYPQERICLLSLALWEAFDYIMGYGINWAMLSRFILIAVRRPAVRLLGCLYEGLLCCGADWAVRHRFVIHFGDNSPCVCIFLVNFLKLRDQKSFSYTPLWHSIVHHRIQPFIWFFLIFSFIIYSTNAWMIIKGTNYSFSTLDWKQKSHSP